MLYCKGIGVLDESIFGFSVQTFTTPSLVRLLADASAQARSGLLPGPSQGVWSIRMTGEGWETKSWHGEFENTVYLLQGCAAKDFRIFPFLCAGITSLLVLGPVLLDPYLSRRSQSLVRLGDPGSDCSSGQGARPYAPGCPMPQLWLGTWF